VLNSGSLHLAASFGVPSVLPDEPHLRAEFGAEGWIRWFDTDDAVGSLAALLSGPVGDASGAEEFSRRLAPFARSREYAEVLDAV